MDKYVDTFFNSYDYSRLIDNTNGMILIDTGCSKTVCGLEWLKNYEKDGGKIL